MRTWGPRCETTCQRPLRGRIVVRRSSTPKRPGPHQLLWWALHYSSEPNAFLVSTYATLVSLYKWGWLLCVTEFPWCPSTGSPWRGCLFTQFPSNRIWKFVEGGKVGAACAEEAWACSASPKRRAASTWRPARCSWGPDSNMRTLGRHTSRLRPVTCIGAEPHECSCSFHSVFVSFFSQHIDFRILWADRSCSHEKHVENTKHVFS